MKRIVKASEFDDELSYPLAKEIARICEGVGYKLYECNRLNSTRLFLSIITPREGYFPDVYYDKDGFHIQTTSYGTLSPDLFKEFLRNQDAALNMVNDIQDAINLIGVTPETVALYVD